MTDTTTDAEPGFVIDSVFSLADATLKSEPQESEEDISQLRETIEKLIYNSPIPIRKCSIQVDNFIEKDIRNKITEACNNSIIKQEPSSDSTEKSGENDAAAENVEIAESSSKRPARKRKPNSLMSTEFVYKNEDLREYRLLKNQKKVRQEEVKCQIDHDLVMSVAEKCLPKVVEKSEHKEDTKMVSILPPTLQININDTQVLVDWKEKIVQPPEDAVVPMRPQTARTKRKLRTQEQIDRENAENAKKKRQKQKSRTTKKASKDPSPPHLEPYDGQFGYTAPTDTPGSPGGLPPNLMPYEIESRVENLKKKIKTVKKDLISNLKTDSEKVQDKNTCSLNGRMRKPNQQFQSYLVTDIQKITKDKQSPQVTKSVKAAEQNTTINHENNTVQVTMLPNTVNHSSISSSTIPNILNQASNYIAPQVSAGHTVQNSTNSSPMSPAPQTSQAGKNSKLSTAIGELAKIENTKKFFQLVVGDKIVLIPTDGNNVVPKAFVMDIAATKPGSSIAQVRAPAPKLDNTVKKGQPLKQTIIFPPALKQMQPGSNVSIVKNSVANVLPAQQTQVTKNTSQPTQVTKNTSQPTQITKNTFQPTSPIRAAPLSMSSSSVLQQMVKIQQSSATSSLSTTAQGQKIILPKTAITSNSSPYPTYIFSNITGVKSNIPTGNIVSKPQVLYSSPSGQGNIQSTPRAETNYTSTLVTQVKKEPDNIKDYEKAASSFKGVPDDGSDTESDTETQSAQAKRQSEKLNTIVPEVCTHVPSSESQAAERIRKLKEKLRQQQLEVENLRKNVKPKDSSV